MIEVLGNQEREAQAGHVVAFFHRANRLAADTNRFGELFLGHALLLAECAETIVDSVSCHSDATQLNRHQKNRQERLTDSVKSAKYQHKSLIFKAFPQTTHLSQAEQGWSTVW